MKTLVLVISIFISASLQAWSQTSPSVQRQELFNRAYKSIAFLMTMATSDKVFYDALSTDEKKMFAGIKEMTMETTTVNWLEKNKAYKLKQGSRSTYLSISYPTVITPFTSRLSSPPQLKFSSDQSLFKLDPLQPFRSGMTTTALDGDIFVNLEKINDSNAQIDFANAVSLIIHEFGHKLADKKIQSAVDSAAAQMEKYIRSLVSTTVIADKKISTLSFFEFGFKEWAQSTLFGKYQGEQAPRTPFPFSVFDHQGLYVWVEDQNKITDLSESIYDTVGKAPLVPIAKQEQYEYLRQTLLRPSRLQVRALPDGSFKVAADYWLAELTVPFMKQNSPDPEMYQVYYRSFKSMQPWVEKTIAQEFTFSGIDYKLKSKKDAAPVIEAPQLKVEFVDKKVKGGNLEIYFAIKGNRHVNGEVMPGEKDRSLWPEVIVQIGQAKVTLKATNYYEDSDEFKFVIKDIDSVKDLEIKVVGMQLKLANDYLATNTNVIVKSFLPSEVLLNKKLDGALTPNNPPTIKSIQVWDGKSWNPLRQRAHVHKGDHLRFVFDSNERLRELNIHQDYNVIYHSTVVNGGYETTEFKTPRIRDMHFSEESMRQTIVGDTLYVDINIDQNVITEVVPDLSNTDWFEAFIGRTKEGVLSIPSEKRTLALKTDELRGLLGLSFVTASGLSNEIDFKTQLNFKKPAGSERPTENSMKFKTIPAKKYRCERLF